MAFSPSWAFRITREAAKLLVPGGFGEAVVRTQDAGFLELPGDFRVQPGVSSPRGGCSLCPGFGREPLGQWGLGSSAGASPVAVLTGASGELPGLLPSRSPALMCALSCVLQAVRSSCLERRQKLPDQGRGPDFRKSQEHTGSDSNSMVGWWCPGESDM